MENVLKLGHGPLSLGPSTEHVLGELGRRNSPYRLSSLEEAMAADSEARSLAEQSILARAAA